VVAVERDGLRKREGRRSAREIRSLLLGTARELFSAQGFAGTSTRDIAAKADVSEALLFRHFGGKRVLFDKAIVEPFTQFINEFVDRWQDPARSHAPEMPAREYVAGLYQQLRKHQGLIMALLAYKAHTGDGAGSRDSAISDVLDRLEDVIERELSEFGFTGVDVDVVGRLVFGMVLATALFDDWLFPHGARHPSQKRIIDEMVAFMLHGIGHRPKSKSPRRAR